VQKIQTMSIYVSVSLGKKVSTDNYADRLGDMNV